MQVQVAQNAGFCAGVRRAVKIAEETVAEGGKWCSLGPLVHNDAVINYFKEKGVNVADSLEQIGQGCCGIIIRSHGVSAELIDQAQKMGLLVKDATCPLVKRVHNIVALLQDEGYEIVIFGDADHPEVQGIIGWCGGKAAVVAGVDEVCDLQAPNKKIGLVSQTTKNENDFLEVARVLIAKTEELRFFNTICSASRKRREAARDLCLHVDLMLVIGDKKSSNTAALARECLHTGVRTFQIQDVSEIENDWFDGVTKVGITAGASTPDWIIKEVLDRMLEYEENNNQEKDQKMDQGESFIKMEAEMADFTPPSRGDIIKGTVIQVLDDEVMVDVGGKSEGIIPLRELSVKEVSSAKEIAKVGDEVEVLVLKWDDDGGILLSKKRVDYQRALEELEEVFKEGREIEGTVVNSIKGGLLVDIGVIAFLPASHVDDGYVRNLDEYVGKKLKFKIIEFNRNKKRGSQVVLSRKEVISKEKTRLKEEFWQGVEIGQVRRGRVKRIVDYGAFIDLGGYEGLLHVSEISHERVEHPSDVLTEGEELDVYVLDIDREKERVSLSRKKLLKSPWEIVLEKYREGDIIEGKVVRIAPFGAFVEIEPGVDGLVHISQLADYRVEKPEDEVEIGQQIKAKIINIDAEKKRIGLSLKEAENEIASNEVEEYLSKQEQEEDR